ncbi:MAG: polyphosphate kinase 2 family protein [Stagnimonas sp.]|nr:polyphosphate kinase 2 family protein [Stagnimonas sp.]
MSDYTAPESRWRVPYDEGFKIAKAATTPPRDSHDKQWNKARLAKMVARIDQLQQILYAHDHRSLLLIFQAMDAAGKDSTIRAVLSGVNPAGCQVSSFKQPSMNELDHDFLWRTGLALPERGRIGVFNRSYYEEVLTVRVHPEYLRGQRLPKQPDDIEKLWQQRYESIRDHEKHLARNGTVILKFWLNVSKDEQRDRFLARLDEPEKNWKFNGGDVGEREHWRAYMAAYEDALKATSRPYAPWYAIPADSKSYMRLTVAEIVVQALEAMNLRYPVLDAAEQQRFAEMRRSLVENEAPKLGLKERRLRAARPRPAG